MPGTINMNKSNALEKSRGAVVIAFNSQIDYVSIAVKCARLIKQHLGIPTAIITDSQNVPGGVFSHVIPAENNIINNKGDNLTWRNANRYQVYELSPFDETVLLDSDYLVLTDNINRLWDSTSDYRLMHTTYSPTAFIDSAWSATGLPYVWATIILFKKTARSQQLFDLVGRVQRNYDYYCKLYNISDSNFRNDYAFAIANNIISGYQIEQSQSIPWSMFSLGKDIKRLSYDDNKLTAVDEQGAWVFHKQDVHVHDKHYLSSNEFNQLIDKICEADKVS